VTGKLTQLMTGVDVVNVPYAGGGSALKDLIGGQVQMMFEPMPASTDPSGQPHFAGDTRRARRRCRASDHGRVHPGFEASAVTGIGVPANTPAESSNGSTRRSTRPRPDDEGAPRRHRRRHACGSPAEFKKSSPKKSRSGPRWSRPPAPPGNGRSTALIAGA
jgi:hypothetical protein